MKKISRKKQQYFIRKSKKNFTSNKKREYKKKKKRLDDLQKRINEKRSRKFANNPNRVKHNRLTAPKNFSFLENLGETISFFEKATESFSNKTAVYFDLSQVENLTIETVTYLCAFVKNTKIVNSTPFQGNEPVNKTTKKMIIRSGFYDFVHTNRPQERIDDKYGRIINRVSRTRVEPELAGKIALSAIKHSYGSKDIKDLKKIYEILIECMANTKNHAAGNNKQKYNWWLLAYKEHTTKVTKFCFLDIGIGIFDSLEKKHKNNSLSKLFKQLFVPNDHLETLTNIFGGTRKSSVNLPGRGQGINHIYNNTQKENNIKRLVIISNDVLAEIGYNQENKIIKIDSNFKGTMYYWELNPNE